MSELIFCLMGPTASGKTDLACELVRLFPFEIISVDSAMVYRHMDIGTAKPDEKTLKQAPHHLIDILDPTESYSAANFCDDVDKLSQSIKQRGKIPLLVGGTMMYFRALQQGLAQLPPANEAIRTTLLQEAEQHGWPHLHKRLALVDPITAARVHAHDSQRIQRALEVYQLAGMPLSKLFAKKTSAQRQCFVNLKLIPSERQWLHERIGLRFQKMLSMGLVEEVEKLMKDWQLDAGYPSMRSVGYRQVFAYLQGEYDRTVLVAKGTAATRQLAKRQLTWLKTWPESIQLTCESSRLLHETIAIIEKIIDNKRL